MGWIPQKRKTRHFKWNFILKESRGKAKYDRANTIKQQANASNKMTRQ